MSEVQVARAIPWDALTDTQKRRIELRQAMSEDPEYRNVPLAQFLQGLKWQAAPPPIYNLYKDRWAEAVALMGARGGWDIDCMPVADFGNVNLAGAGTIRTGFNVLPLANPAMSILKSPDPEPYQEPGGTLAAVNGDRQIGSGYQQLVVLIGAYLVHITSGAAVYQPAGSTVNVRVCNSVTTVIGAFTTLATINATTAANGVDVVPITGTTGRFISLEGGANAAAAALFNGDSVFCELVTTGALNVQGNLLYVMLELA